MCITKCIGITVISCPTVTNALCKLEDFVMKIQTIMFPRIWTVVNTYFTLIEDKWIHHHKPFRIVYAPAIVHVACTSDLSVITSTVVVYVLLVSGVCMVNTNLPSWHCCTCCMVDRHPCFDWTLANSSFMFPLYMHHMSTWEMAIVQASQTHLLMIFFDLRKCYS